MNKCAVCGRPLPNISAPTEWEWFTGYLPDRAVFCPSHKDSALFHWLRALSLDKTTPEKYLTIEQAIKALSSTGAKS